MDAQMDIEDISGAYPIWDVKVEGGLVPIISGDEEDVQTATLAGFLEAGSIPQLPEMGVPWTDFLTGKITFGELDADIHASLSAAGKDEYRPEYEINGDRLTMTVTKES